MKNQQIPALDGLRALAITMVIASHSRNDFVFAGGKEIPRAIFSGIDYLWTGVDLFFVLSGFLIGRILFQEVKRTGTLKPGPFLLKRGFRIWPLYFFICFFSLAKLAITHHFPSLATVAPDFLFLTNFYPEHLAFGTWSLSIEEQFYILAAAFIFFSKKWIVHSGKKTASFLVFLLLVAPILRFFTWQQYHANGMSAFDIEWSVIHNFITTHYDGIVVGLFFASVDVFLSEYVVLKKCLAWILPTVTLALCALTAIWPLFFTYSLAAMIFGSTMWYCLQKPEGLIARAFSWPGFHLISRLSYGMYLWYRFPPWRIAQFTMTRFPNVPPLVQYSIVFVLAFACATLLASITYMLIEKPFLDLRSRVYQKRERLVYAEA